jgi:hypothetical protein
MRWHRLFDDLAAQAAGLEEQERAAAVAEQTRAERGQLELVQRAAAALGRELQIRVGGVGWVEGTLRDVGRDWLLLEGMGAPGSRGRELLLPLAAVSAVGGLPVRVDQRTAAASRRFGLRQTLRAISRDRAPVRLHDRAGNHLTGTIDRVLADHLDLTRHADDEPRRPAAVRGSLAVRYDELSLVRRL